MIQNADATVSKGPFAPDETVFLISVGSASTATQNEVEFCISKFGIITDITQELVFVDAMKDPLLSGNFTVSTGDIILSSTSVGSGRIQFAARDSSGTVPYFMGVDALWNGGSWKL